jgi:hypothetical protein
LVDNTLLLLPESHLEHGHSNELDDLMSPSIPQPSIVEDESDYDLNEDRKILANIRKERAESWQLDDTVIHPNNRANYNIAITNMNHFGSNEADL